MEHVWNMDVTFMENAWTMDENGWKRHANEGKFRGRTANEGNEGKGSWLCRISV